VAVELSRNTDQIHLPKGNAMHLYQGSRDRNGLLVSGSGPERLERICLPSPSQVAETIKFSFPAAHLKHGER
jgi:hypothetical protein